MKFFGKNIGHLYIFDFLPGVTKAGQLKDFCNKHIFAKVETPSNRADFFNILSTIAATPHEGGVILQIMAHGEPRGYGFGRDKSFAISWPEIVLPFTQLNSLWNDSLIINASTTCFSHPLAQLMLNYPTMSHAVLYSIAERTDVAVQQNIKIYESCLTVDNAANTITTLNDDIFDNMNEPKIRPYGYIAH